MARSNGKKRLLFCEISPLTYAISEQKAEGDVESLFNSTETTALQGDCSHIDAFELVAFFVVKEAEA